VLCVVTLSVGPRSCGRTTLWCNEISARRRVLRVIATFGSVRSGDAGRTASLFREFKLRRVHRRMSRTPTSLQTMTRRRRVLSSFRRRLPPRATTATPKRPSQAEPRSQRSYEPSPSHGRRPIQDSRGPTRSSCISLSPSTRRHCCVWRKPDNPGPAEAARLRVRIGQGARSRTERIAQLGLDPRREGNVPAQCNSAATSSTP
jgi:hypothetical protein